jgi:excinuclease ABC subunit A
LDARRPGCVRLGVFSMAKADRQGCIRIIGASQNNLKNIDIEIPHNRLTVITGVSGSGKSSLAFDTLYAEGQRRYVESLSAYARQFLERINKPAVREIQGISPAIAIRQKNSARNPRSTVGTVTEIYDYLRLLYARIGIILCRQCGREVGKNTIDEIVREVGALPEGTRIYISFPFLGSLLDPRCDGNQARISLPDTVQTLVKQGFRRLLDREDGKSVRQLPEDYPRSWEELDKTAVLVDRLVIAPDSGERLADSLQTCYIEGNGVAEVTVADPPPDAARESMRFTERFECQYCHIPYRQPEPRLFSFNNPYGACPTCQGFGNTICLDPERVIPDAGKSLREGPIDPFLKPRYQKFQTKLITYAEQQGLPLDVPFRNLPEMVRRKIWTGDRKFPGVAGFFRFLESKKYKMHVRIFISRYRGYTRCPDCEGERLRQDARDVYLSGRRISHLTCLPVADVDTFFQGLELSPWQQSVAEKVVRELRQRLRFLVKVGLEYLTLDRLTSTLSGGEAQRIQLAASLSSSLVGTLYILDEPSIGLHPRDEKKLIEILKDLRDLGNTVVVVEHEREMIEAADQVIDMGPGAGELGGHVVYSGNTLSLVKSSDSLTGRYLSGAMRIPIPTFRRSCENGWLTIHEARHHNLKEITVRIPLGVLTCVTGVSGSGKSTLVQDVLCSGLKRVKSGIQEPALEYGSITGAERISEVLLVDQSPIGKTPRSNPVTYIKAFDDIRQIFASLPEARAHQFSPGHFSFNVPGGRCETCQGSGTVTVEMQFLADLELTCEECKGSRFKSKILGVTFKGKSIADVLSMTVNEAVPFFKAHSSLVRKLKVLVEIGLGYLRLGQSATTLSGGEAQRVKLASYLSREAAGRPLFIFDEPTTGLHFDDIQKLMRSFDKLIAHGATVLVIEHNLDVVKSADWVIDLGPEGGESGGYLVAEGPPEAVARTPGSYTGSFLRGVLGISDRPDSVNHRDQPA